MIHGSYLNLTSSDTSPSANLTLSERSDDEIAIILPKNHGLSDFPLYGGYLQKTSEFTFKLVVEEDILNLILYLSKIRNSKTETRNTETDKPAHKSTKNIRIHLQTTPCC